MKSIPVLIDTDPAIGIFRADVDDGLAILLALNSEKIEVDGITAVYGNTNVNNTYRIAKELLEVAKHTDIPVYKGAYNATWLGVRTPAVQFLIDHIMEHPGEITLITLAPLTNVATAFLLEPKLAENLKALLMMGGYFFPSNFKIPFLRAEFNFSRDTQATKIILNQDVDTTIVGIDVTTQVKFRDAHYAALQLANTPITDYLTKHIKFWLMLNKIVMGGFNPHDPICVAYLIQKSLFKYVKASVDVFVAKPKEKPEHVHKHYPTNLLQFIPSLFTRDGQLTTTIPPSDPRTNKIKVCTRVNEKAFLQLLISELSKKF
ncbi:MAG: nucleoside hydrolase [Candidatus Helarchaeota archaeon]|nr:nucleoside hydrolase [Candidatus Helarchaeota archaeon]